MDRVLLAVAIALAVAAVALILQRRRPEAPSQRRWAVPDQVDRNDFDRPGDTTTRHLLATRLIVAAGAIGLYAIGALWLNRMAADQPFTAAVLLGPKIWAEVSLAPLRRVGALPSRNGPEY